MTFKSWLKKSKYIKENSFNGDLARDISIDADFPNSIEKYVILNYLPKDENIEKSFNTMYSDFIRYISRSYEDDE